MDLEEKIKEQEGDTLVLGVQIRFLREDYDILKEDTKIFKENIKLLEDAGISSREEIDQLKLNQHKHIQKYEQLTKTAREIEMKISQIEHKEEVIKNLTDNNRRYVIYGTIGLMIGITSTVMGFWLWYLKF